MIRIISSFTCSAHVEHAVVAMSGLGVGGALYSLDPPKNKNIQGRDIYRGLSKLVWGHN